jgi:hypothetical protein
MTSYFMWLAEHHPAIFASLLGRAMPQIMQHETSEDPIEGMIRTADVLTRSRDVLPYEFSKW